jgi:hypothetical protein
MKFGSIITNCHIEPCIMPGPVCSECRETVQDDASACPHCGATFESDGLFGSIGWLSNDVLLIGGGIFLYVATIPFLLGFNKLSLLIGFVWIGILLFASWI